MKVYLIYAIMQEDVFHRANHYGQYDNFLYGNGKTIDGAYCVLWGFTDRKKYKDRFLFERPVKHRFLVQEKEVEESEYSNFMMDYFRYELLPTYLDERFNIGERDGFQAVSRMMTRVEKQEESFYCNRIMTKYEYDYLVNNLGEICTEIERLAVSEPSLPIVSTIFQEPLRSILMFFGYDQLCRIYHPNGPKFLIQQKERGIDVTFQDFLPGTESSPDSRNLFSMRGLFYFVFADVIYREGI